MGACGEDANSDSSNCYRRPTTRVMCSICSEGMFKVVCEELAVPHKMYGLLRSIPEVGYVGPEGANIAGYCEQHITHSIAWKRSC